MNNDSMNEEWLKRFRSYISIKKPQLNTYNYNAYNYKYDVMGVEDAVEAYRSAILYIQLSPYIDLDKIEIVIKEIYKHLYNSASNSYGKYHLLFMNDSQGNLMHNGKPYLKWHEAVQAVKDFENNYSQSNYIYSKVLNNLFPFIGLYTRETYPSSEDLCVLITDSEGITIDNNLKKRLISKCNKLISIELDLKREGKIEWIRKI